MPQLDTDTFTYSNGNLATASAAKWTKVSSYADLVVTSNQVAGVNATESASCITTWAGSTTDQYSQCVCVSGDKQFCGPTIINDGANAFYVFDARNNDNRIFKVTAGPTYSELAQSSAVGLSDGQTLYIERVAGVITCKINGVTAVTVTDTALVSGKPGLRCFSNATPLDTWAAGDFGAGASVVPVLAAQYRARRS